MSSLCDVELRAAGAAATYIGHAGTAGEASLSDAQGEKKRGARITASTTLDRVRRANMSTE
jgi:hypothetical protein